VPAADACGSAQPRPQHPSRRRRDRPHRARLVCVERWRIGDRRERKGRRFGAALRRRGWGCGRCSE
jgi:hypothetical protein